MKKIGAILILLLIIFCPLSNVKAKGYALESGQAYVISSKCDLYTLPDFNSPKVVDENNEIISLKHMQNVEILEINGDFAQIMYKNYSGYAYKYYLTSNSSPTVYPVFNATIRKDCDILNVDKTPSGYTAKKNDRIYIYQGYDEKVTLTAIQIVLEDGTLYNGYVSTEFVKPDGISSLLIVGLTIIIAAVTVILSLIFIKKKKK